MWPRSIDEHWLRRHPPPRHAVGEYYLRQWPVVVGYPRARVYRLPYALAGTLTVRGVPAWRYLPGPLGETGLGGVELPDLLTPMTPDEAAQALAEGYRLVTGRAPTQRVLGLLLGQTALETGNWKSLHNWNFGNAKATASDPYYQNFRCSEIIGGAEQFFDPPDPHCRFVAHRTAADGAEHYIRVLKSRTAWWNGLHTETVPGFVAGLTTAPYAYFTANPELYARGLADRMAQYAGQAARFAGAHKAAIVGTTVGVFALTFGGWYLYNTVTSKRKRAA